MIVFAVLALLLSLVALHDLVRRPSIRRVALRNLSRRVGEASLVVFGSALGTAIIAGAFIVGDTFDSSIRDIARTDYGPIDTIATLDDPSDVEAGVAALGSPAELEGVDGLAGFTWFRAAIATVATDGDDLAGSSSGEVADDRLADPQITISTADFGALRSLGPDSSGLAEAGPTPVGDEVVLDRSTAETLGVAAGDPVEIFAYGSSATFEVRTIVDRIGVAGYGEVFIAPDAFAGLIDLDSVEAAPPVGQVLVSHDGDVFDSTLDPEANAAIDDLVTDRLDGAGIGHDTWDAKADLLEDAADEGAEITEIFTAVGGFSVLAGVLLLVNLFVMLAEERKTSLGVLRAIGWRRGHLVRSFVLEGAAYGVLASVIGALVGIPVGWVIVRATEQIFASSDVGLELRLAIEPRSLVLAGLVGLVISLVVSWATSARISRLNIIRAIRDLPEPTSSRRRRLALVGGAIGVVAGIVVAVLGVSSDGPAALLVGGALALFSAIPLLDRILPGRSASVLAGLAVIAWAIGVFSVFADVMQDPPIAVFLLQGVLLVAGAVAVSSSIGPWWARLLDRAPTGSGPSTKLGLAYPTARRFRTGVSLAMFSLIVFSLTFIAVLSLAFEQQADAFTDESSAGFDALLESNPANPVPTDALAAADGVASVAPVLRGGARFSAAFDEPTLENPAGWAVSGIDQAFTSSGAAPELVDRDGRFGSDVEVFEAVAADPTLAVVATWFLGGGDEGDPVIGDTFTMVNDADQRRELTIVGLMENDWVFGGVFLSADTVREHLPGQFATRRHYVAFADGTDVEAGTARLNGRFVENGADTESFASIIGNEVREQRGFFNLLSGYLSLGLLIGVAGLGVVMVRAVRERRAQVGTLRSMGMTVTGIRSMFLTEGGFVALQGVLSGVLLGLASSYQLLVRSNTFEIQLDFVVPWLALSVIALMPLAAAALASAIPARRASRIPVAAALRLSD